MMKHYSFRRLAAMTAAIALAVTASVSSLALAEKAEKHFSIVEAASQENALSIPEIAKKCRTSVVAIETETTVVYNNYDSNYYNPFGSMFGFPGFGYGYGYPGSRGNQREYTQTGAGSGIILSEDGYILTNNHVIAGVDKITVYIMPEEAGAEEATYEAKLIGTSESNDVAVLKIEAEGLNAASFGDSDQLELGELAVAIGNPMGTVHGSVTAGIISAKERELTIDDVTIKAIQTDAAINPGNSGGALVNMRGQVIGINSAKYSDEAVEGMCFAIPVNTAMPILEELMSRTTRVEITDPERAAYLGINYQDINAAMAEAYRMPVGVYVTAVGEGSPAEKAGLLPGDIITKFDHDTITGYASLRTALPYYAAGETVDIVVQRPERGQYVETTITITLGARPAEQQAEAPAQTPENNQGGQSGQGGSEYPSWFDFFGW